MAEYVVRGPNGKRYKITAPGNLSEYEVRMYAQSQIGAMTPPQEEEEDDVGFFGAAGNAIMRMGNRARGLVDASMAEDFATLADARAAQDAREAERAVTGEEPGMLERILTYRPSWAAPLESEEELRGLAADKVVQQTQRNQQAAIDYPMTKAGQAAIQDLAEAGSFREGLGIVVDKPLDVLSGVAQVGIEQAPTLGAAIVGSAVTRDPRVGMGIMAGSTYGQERFGQMAETAQRYGYDLTNPDDAKKAVADSAFMAEQEERGMARGAVIATIDAFTLGLGSKLPVSVGGLAGNTALQIAGGGAGEATAQVATDGTITSPGEVIVESLAEGTTAPLDVAMFVAGNRSGVEVDTQSANALAQENAQLEAEAAAEQADNEQRVGLARVQAAREFIPFKTFQDQKAQEQLTEVLNSETEVGQDFLRWIANTRTPERPYPQTDKEFEKEAKAYIKDNTAPGQSQALFDEYNTLLDDHSSFKAEAAQRTPQAQQQAETLIADLLQQRAEARAAGDADAEAKVDATAESMLQSGEWRFAKLKADGQIKDTTPTQEAPTQPEAPTAAAQPNVETNLIPETDAQTEAPAQPEAPTTEAAPEAPAAIDPIDMPVRRRTEAVKQIEALVEDGSLPPNWSDENVDLNSALNGQKFVVKKYKAELDKVLNPVEETPTTEAVTASEGESAPQIISGMEQRAEAYATEKLGDNWRQEYPALVEMIKEKRFAGLQSNVDRIAGEQAVESKQEENDAKAAARQRQEEQSTEVVDQFTEAREQTALSGQEQKVFDVLQNAFQNNEQDAVLQADGKWNTAEIGERAGVGAKTANTYINRIMNKIAESQGRTAAEVKERLAATRIGEVEAFDESATDPMLDASQLGDGMGTLASVGQGTNQGRDAEDIAYANERANEPDQYENKRQQIADRQRQKMQIQMVQDYGKNAMNTWRNLSSENAVRPTELSKTDLMEWISTVQEFEEGMIDQATLSAEQREIEMRYDAQPAPEITDETNTIEGTAEETTVDAGPSASPESSPESGDTTEQVGATNTPTSLAEFEQRTENLKVEQKKKRRKYEPQINKQSNYENNDNQITDDTPDGTYYDFTTIEEGLDYVQETGTAFERALTDRIRPFIEEGNFSYRVVDDPVADLDPVIFTNLDFYKENPEEAVDAAQRLERRVSRIWDEMVPPYGLYADTGDANIYRPGGVVMLRGAGLSDGGPTGLNNRTFLHEALHAVTSNMIYRAQSRTRYPSLDYPDSPAMEAAQGAVADLENVLTRLEREYPKETGDTQIDYLARVTGRPREEAEQTWNLFNRAIRGSVQELVAYGFTDAGFQRMLDTVIVEDGVKKESAFKKFVAAVRRIIGMDPQTFKDEVTGLEQVIRVTDQLLSLQGRVRDEQGGVNVTKLTDLVNQSQDLKSPPPAPEQETQQQVSYVRKNFGDGAAEALTNLRNVASTPIDATKNIDRIIRDNQKAMPSARRWYDTMLEAQATSNDVLTKVENVINQSRKFNRERKVFINDFIGSSTFFQKWGYDPQWTDPKTGKAVKVTIDPVMKKKYDRLTSEEQQLVRDLFQHGRDMQLMMQEIAQNLGVSQFFKLDSSLQGPYAPLKRFGNYVGELKSQELLDAEAAFNRDQTPANRKKVEALKSNGDHYVVSFFESQGAADTFVAANQDQYAQAEASEKAVTYEEARPGGAKAYEKILGAVNANLAGLDQASKDAMAKMVRDMYFQTLDDSNARLSGTKRLNRAGYDKDMIRAFAEHGMAQANLVAQMKHGADISSALVEARKEAGKNPRDLMPIYNKVALKFQRMMSPRAGMFANLETSVMKFNSFYMLTSSLGYFLQNMTQPYFAAAQIAGEFGFKQQPATFGKLISGYGVAKKVINTGFLNQVKNVASMGLLGGNSTVELDIDQAPPELRPVFKELAARGLLDVGVAEDLRHANMSPNIAARAYDELTHRLYQSARYVEANNRIASAVAAFRMAQRNPQKMRKLKTTPAEFAVQIVQDTQGNFSQLDAPAAFDVLLKAPLQFRKYQFQMAWLHVDAAKQALQGADAEMKAAGFRKLSLMMGYTGVLGGLVSVPMANVASAVIQAVIGQLEGDDEENPPKSLERWVRENVDDERTATLLTRGVPAALGWDFSQKLDQSDLFMPYNSKYVELDPSRDGALLFAAQLALGPTGTMVGNVGNVLDFVERGNMYRAAEYMMPKGLRAYFETLRFADSGYETRAGLTITDPTTFDVGDFLSNAIGLPSTEINQIKWKRGQQVEIEQWFSNETSRIKRGYLAAYEDRDREAMKEYREEFRELQRAKDRVRPFFNDSRNVLKRAPMTELLRAPRTQRREQRRLDTITGR